MRRLIAIALILLMLSGCGAKTEAPAVPQETTAPAVTVLAEPEITEVAFESRFHNETLIELSDNGIKTKALSVFASKDIVYYEDRDTYASGNPYGEGEAADKHTAEEADAHIVVNITEAGRYRVTGKLSAGQICVDLGNNAYEDENAVVELILDNADITCTVAPAIVFRNVYECDGLWSEDTAKAEIDTSKAGANLILEGENTVSGSYVAQIYKDKDGKKNLWEQDGAIYSYMSMNVFGPGALELNAVNEGICSELHLTINGGDIVVRSGNDGINTNEDNVSVTTINGGNVRILAGLGAEGDGIDSNGYLVINGGKVMSAAHPAADAGLDSDRGSFIHGGTVIALGSTMDWAESDSTQETINLQFAASRNLTDVIEISKEDGTKVFTFDPAADEALKEVARTYTGAIISTPNFKQGESYLLTVGGQQMQYGGTDVQRFPGGMGQPPEGFDGQIPADMDLPEGFGKIPSMEDPQMGEGFEGFNGRMPEGFDGQMPEGWTPGQRGERPEGFEGQRPEGMGEPPQGFDGQRPEGFSGEKPEGFAGFGGQMPEEFNGQMPEGFDSQFPDGFGGPQQSGEGSILFYMRDKVNSFSGVSEVK